jgi:hypothetical protein
MISALLERVSPGAALDPMQIAAQTELPVVDVLGFLELFREAQMGELLVRVVDNRGLEVGRFPNVLAIPPQVEDQFGDVTDVDPEHVQIVFVPAPA